jgi:hypothetical protein
MHVLDTGDYFRFADHPGVVSCAQREDGAYVVRAATPLLLAQRSEARANLF